MADAPAFSIVDWESCNEDCLQESSVTEQLVKEECSPQTPLAPLTWSLLQELRISSF